MAQMFANGGEVGIANLIENHECSKTPASLFNEDVVVVVVVVEIFYLQHIILYIKMS